MEAVKNTQWSEENSVELIRKLRNDLLKDFLDERFLKEYISSHYNVRELSNVKIEFIKKELKELLLAPLDLGHYESIFTHLKETDSASLGEGNDQLFYAEIEKVLKRYIY
jgi:hypothetical protein